MVHTFWIQGKGKTLDSNLSSLILELWDLWMWNDHTSVCGVPIMLSLHSLSLKSRLSQSDRDRHVNKDKAARAVSWLWWRFAWSAWRLIISSRVRQATKREGSSRRGHVQGAGHREEHGTCRGLKGLWGPRIEQQAMCHFSVPAALGEVTLTHSMWPSWVVCPCARLAGHRTGTAHPGWALTVT